MTTTNIKYGKEINFDPENNKDDFQIILSTGIEEYPSNFKEYVFDTLTERNRLLKPNKKKIK